MIAVESRSQRVIIGRLEKGDDLHQALLAAVTAFKIRTGLITALGALDHARLCEYNQTTRRYEPALTFSGAMEVLNMTGNVSTRDGAPFLHLHTLCSQERHRPDGTKYVDVFGGHVVAARVFALEFSIIALDDVTLTRGHDTVTGLALWQPPAAV